MTSTQATFPMMRANAILVEEGCDVMPIANSSSTKPTKLPAADRRWDAVVARDARRDGEFIFAVASTGVYCRPSCPARRPRRENVTFFSHPEHAEKAGYRACLRCKPKSASGNPQSDWAKEICRDRKSTRL